VHATRGTGTTYSDQVSNSHSASICTWIIIFVFGGIEFSNNADKERLYTPSLLAESNGTGRRIPPSKHCPDRPAARSEQRPGAGRQTGDARLSDA
jgi:hypothetical protein